MRIREVSESDIAQVVVIEKTCFSDHPWSAELLRLAAAHESTVFLVAEDDCAETTDGNGCRPPEEGIKEDAPRIAGYVVLRTVAGEGSIDNICVADAYRRRGIAAHLMQAAMDTACARYGAEAFTLEVRISNDAARALYESAGFICEGTRPGYYDAPREDAYIYWKKKQDEALRC